MDQSDLDAEVVGSPCVSICKLSEDGYCLGCHRHTSEINYWLTMSDEEKREVIEACKERAAEANK